MDINALASGTSATSSSTAAKDANGLSSNYEMFLTLLTTQLKVQDPLDPVKADEFTNQLVQYSSIEQQIKMNANMEELIASVQSQNASSMVGYIGTQVEATGVQSILKDGQAAWQFSAGSGAKEAEITIRNSGGAIVYTDKIDIGSGSAQYTWDGSTDSGVDAPEGSYSISIKASNRDGNNVEVETQTQGIVTGVDLSKTEPALMIGDILVPLSSVSSVRAPL